MKKVLFSARHFAPSCARNDSPVKDMRSIAGNVSLVKSTIDYIVPEFNLQFFVSHC